FLHKIVDRPPHVEQDADRPAGVEVVIHRFEEAAAEFEQLVEKAGEFGRQRRGHRSRCRYRKLIEIASRDALERFEQAVETVKALPGLGDVLVAEVDGAAVMSAQKEEADRLRLVLREKLFDRRGSFRAGELSRF